MTQPSAEMSAAVSRAAGRTPAAWRRVERDGYTPAERWIVDLGGGSIAFAKVAAVDRVEDWLRAEHRAYRELDGPFMPRLLGWTDEPMPVLLLDLGG